MKFCLTIQNKWCKADDVETLRSLGWRVEPESGGLYGTTHRIQNPSDVSIEIATLDDLLALLAKVGCCIIGNGADGIGNSLSLGDHPAIHVANDYLDFVEG